MKKNILFYTFLIIFILTAIITLLGVLELIKIKPGYLNTLFTVLIIELVAAVIALFRKTDFFTDDIPPGINKPHAQSQRPHNSTNEMPVASPKCDLTAAEFFHTFHDLEDRFHEQEEFTNRLHGHRICWSGIVNSVSTNANDVCIQLRSSEGMIYNIFHVTIPMELRTKAYALRKGDVILVNGTLNMTLMPMAPSIDNATFELMQKAASGSATNAAPAAS